MANELRVSSTHGTTVYAQVRNLVNQIWNTVTPGFESYSTANVAHYAIAMAEQGTASGQFVGNFPTGIAAGTYQTEAFQQAAGSPAESDALVGYGSLAWSGTAAESSARSSQLPANLATLVIANAGVNLNLAQAGLAPRLLDQVADSALTVGDALVAAICGAAGQEAVNGTSYTVSTPHTATPIRQFTLNSSTAPTSRS